MIRHSLNTFAARLLGWQCALTAAVSLGVAIIYGRSTAYAVFLGAMIGIISTGLFAYLLFREVSVHKAKRIVANFYRAEALKFLLTLGLLFFFIKYFAIAALPLLLGYSMVQVMSWLQLLWVR